MNAELIKINGAWEDIPLYASLSHGKEEPTDPEDLLKRLYNWGHMEPFEFISFVWKLEIPIFLERQLLRHRMSSRVEQSMRYVMLNPTLEDAYIPESFSVPKQLAMKQAYFIAFETYEKLLAAGVPKEQARAVLPLGLNTKMFVMFNARSFDNFLKLRLDKHAQPEMQKLAKIMLSTLKEYPEAKFLWRLWMERYLPGKLEEEEEKECL